VFDVFAHVVLTLWDVRLDDYAICFWMPSRGCLDDRLQMVTVSRNSTVCNGVEGKLEVVDKRLAGGEWLK
jgi:hypothetical protein